MQGQAAAPPPLDPSTARSESPLVISILKGTVPRAIRLAAARGALPVPRADLFRLLVALVGDDDEEIRREADACMRTWSEDELQGIASDDSTDQNVLAFLLMRPESRSTLLAKVLSNGSSPLEGLLEAARTFDAEKLDTLLLNQTLLIRHPGLLDAVETNPAATPLHLSRVEEVRRHFLKTTAAPPPATSQTRQPDPSGVHSDAHSGDANRSAEAWVRTDSPATHDGRHLSGTSAHTPGDAPQAEEEEPVLHEGTMQRIFKMNVGEKIQLAAKGTREERTILIRDSNRSVQDAALNSPKITESEIESIAKMRNVNEDILRQIAGHRDWMKTYAVVQGLATNPKTPLGIAMNLIPRLTTHDLKTLQTDKNVPEAIRRMARKQVELRVNKPGSARGGGH